MEQNAQRELRSADPQWTVSELMTHVEKAMNSDGPALSFGNCASTQVPQQVSVVVGTSGSSGVAKEVGLSRLALVTSAQSANKYLGAQPGHMWSLLLPLTHIAGINILTRSLELGTESVDLRNWSGVYPTVDFTAIVPTQLFAALNGDGNLLKHLTDSKAVLVGGAPLADEILIQAQHAGINVVTTYGMTETCGGCIYNGQPLEGVEIEISHDKQISIKGSVLADTYIGNESLWKESFSNGWFKTSDLGHMHQGKLLLEGRSDDVIISGGENISLSAIELALGSHFKKNFFAAFSLKDPQWGESLHVAIAGNETLAEKEVVDFLSDKFGAFAKPKGFLKINELPMIGIGKVDRAALAQLFTEASH